MMTLSNELTSRLIQTEPDGCVGDLEVMTHRFEGRYNRYTKHLLVFKDLQTDHVYGFHYNWWFGTDIHKAKPSVIFRVHDPETQDIIGVQPRSVSFTFEPRPNYILEDT